MFLRELPEPLVPFELTQNLLEISTFSLFFSLLKLKATAPTTTTGPNLNCCGLYVRVHISSVKIEVPNTRLTQLQNVLRDGIPREHPRWAILCRLLLHLTRVAAEKQKNKMDSANLAIVFGPSLVRISILRRQVF
jgi:hypothetical protein